MVVVAVGVAVGVAVTVVVGVVVGGAVGVAVAVVVAIAIAVGVMLPIALTLGDYVDRCVAHALTVLAPAFPGQDLAERDCEVFLFRQSWPNTACGWPGIAGQAFTDAYTVVVLGPHSDAVVYLGRPAYILPYPPGDVPAAQRENFFAALAAHRMPAVRDCATIGCRRFA